MSGELNAAVARMAERNAILNALRDRHVDRKLGELIELDDLQTACDSARAHIRLQIHDAHDRVAHWDLPEYQP